MVKRIHNDQTQSFNKGLPTLKKLATAALLMSAMTGLNASELSKSEQAALDQYKTLQSLPQAERKAYRQQLFAGMSEQEKDAFKMAVDKGLGLETDLRTQLSAKSAVVRAPGTSITYDNGTGLGVVVGTNSNMQGNRFDSGLNAASTFIEAVETSGSITQLSFDAAVVNGGAVFISVMDNIVGTTANLVTSVSVPATAGLNTFTPGTPIAYTGGPFLAGVWQFGGEGINVSTASVGSQGFHGIEINDVAATAYNSNLTVSAAPVNAMMRVSGNVLQETVPIELIDFTIEEVKK